MNDDQCPCRPLLARLGERWTALLLVHLQSGPRHFGTLQREIEGISRKILAQTLRTLERDGLVTRTVEDGPVLRVRYDLSPLGRSLADPLAAVRAWQDRHQPEVEAARRTYDDRAERPGVTELRQLQSSSRARWSTQTATASRRAVSAPSAILTP